MVRCCTDWASYAHNPLETYQSYALVLNVTSFGTDDKCVLNIVLKVANPRGFFYLNTVLLQSSIRFS